MKCIVVLYVTKRGFDMSDDPLVRFLVQGIFCTPSMLKNHCKYSCRANLFDNDESIFGLTMHEICFTIKFNKLIEEKDI